MTDAPDNGKLKEQLPPESPLDTKKQETPKDFKVCEVWIRDGQIHLDASVEFWSDKCRAIGVLEFCKEIIKTAKQPNIPEDKNIIIPQKGRPLDFLRNRIKGKK